MSKLKQVLDAYAHSLMAIPGVVDVCRGLRDGGEECIRVMIVSNARHQVGHIPAIIEGYDVEVLETGPISYFRRDN